MATKFDKLQLQIKPSGERLARAVILINNQDVLEIARHAEQKLAAQNQAGAPQAGLYHHITAAELYDGLMFAEESQGQEYAPILCCTCDDSRCANVSVKVERTQERVLWNDMCNNCNEQFNLSFCFSAQEYTAFMQKLKQYSIK